VFFYLAKILWALLQPSSLVIAAVVVGAILSTTAWRRLGRRLLMVAVPVLIIGGISPLGDLLIAPLENRFPRTDITRGGSITGIVVLGGAEDGRAAAAPRELAGLNEAAERYTEAAALARRLPNARLVFTGGSGALFSKEPPESETAARLFEALGIAKERITLESASRDTHENALFTTRLIKPATGERWLLVTSAWHMPRAIGCFRRVGFPVEAWPVDFRTSVDFQPLRFHSAITEGWRRIDFVAREYAGLVAYHLSGRTSALYPAPGAER
jgi:uncharacterized SAM-binding protein YcdF (DUF218 family)